MGSVFEIAVWAAPGREPAAADAAHAGLDLVASLEETISEWKPSSEVSAINRAAGGDPVRVGPQTRELVDAMIAWSRETRGAFDPTGGPLFRRWDQAREERVLPPAEEIQRLHALVGWERIELAGDTVRLARPGMMLGTGAIGKGWAADRAAALVRDRGFPDVLVDAGGDVHVSGQRGAEAWTVGVRDPRGDGLLAVLPADAGGVATSGDYERYFVVDGVRYSHLIDLRTGWPARGLASATVIAPNTTAADAVATALSAMGAEEGLAFVNGREDVHAMLVTEDGGVLLSKRVRLAGDRLEVVR